MTITKPNCVPSDADALSTCQMVGRCLIATGAEQLRYAITADTLSGTSINPMTMQVRSLWLRRCLQSGSSEQLLPTGSI